MASVLLRRLSKKSCLDHHRSLPLTTIWWEHTRNISDDRSLGKADYNRISGASSTLISDTQKSELLIVERRRRELLSLSSGKWRMWEEVWLDRLEEIIKFYYKHGRLPSRGAKDKIELSSATWMHHQRTSKRCLDEGKPSKGKMTPERIATLECMSWWVWDAQEAAWQSQFEDLKAYVQTYGKIPSRSDPSCGFWVDTQRMAYRAWKARESGEETDKYKSNTSNMGEERASKLESIPGWSWEPLEDNWESKYQELLEYVEKHNKIPAQSDPNCGFWVDNQRKAYRAWKEPEKYKPGASSMDEERATKLEAVPGWKWNIRG
jgi:hypothetical protein